METLGFAVVATFILAYGMVSGRLDESPITAPMVFVAFGLIAAPEALGLLHLDLDHGLVRVLAEVTLVFVLFVDAMSIDLRRLRRSAGIPGRMLLLGLPLAVIFGTAAGSLILPGLGLWELALLAALLAPTDAALGLAVVTDQKVPARIRQAITVESGLNDGLALPIMITFLAAASATMPDAQPESWLRFASGQLLLGPLVGIAVGVGGGRLAGYAEANGWVNPVFKRLAGISLALLAFSAAELIGGNGFIAAFFAGASLGAAAPDVARRLHDFTETEGQLFILLVFLVFGATMAWPALAAADADADADAAMILYAIVSLTIVRMAAIAISLIGSKLRPQTVVFLGWFGPRGLASIIFAIFVIEQHSLPEADYLLDVVSITVLMSVVAHGVTAQPGVAWYSSWLNRAGGLRPILEPGTGEEVAHHMPEMAEVTPMLRGVWQRMESEWDEIVADDDDGPESSSPAE